MMSKAKGTEWYPLRKSRRLFIGSGRIPKLVLGKVGVCITPFSPWLRKWRHVLKTKLFWTAKT